MMQQQSLDLGLSLGGLTSQGSLSSSTTSGQLSPWAAALSSVRQQQQADHQGMPATRASTSPDSGDSHNNKRDLERTASGGVRGGVSDEEDGADGAGGRKKLRLSKDQAAVLEECFKTHSTLNPKQKLALANRLGLRPRQVEVWFQNRRARTKLKQTEVDCEYLKRWCERLADENKRLEKELDDLRALKAAAPAASSAAATLTMCPSCRRVAAAANQQQQQQQCHPVKSNNVLPSHCQFFPAAIDRTGQSSWNAAAAAAPLVTRELF
ncbi:hypothetical protein PR202_ga18215 [Eleusine coracana subsp. coracana]|uniref:Homeobox domain-containing protein n=1 Tax=Eleusine coracana subsp. coracana TaxID=191504 RepID=A0AAV5CRX5_ELECO|nr:hypothetical protein QOZ80_6AG0508110 [Eleusine coracana subsp. coracana]GJN00986.1 hypothetical protein PR202_ga18215 [Eleusine coracana subsp. coracana]